jgi:hypothetical protein
VTGIEQDSHAQTVTDVPTPRAFAYYRLAGSPHGQAVRLKLEERARSRLDLPEDTIRQFGAAMNTGDRLGDAYIDAAFAGRASKGRARKMPSRP